MDNDELTKRLKLLLMFFLFWSIFIFTNYINRLNGVFYIPKTVIDDAIPLIPSFIVFYSIYYVFPLIPMILSFKDYKLFKKIIYANVFLIAISNLFFIMFPTSVIREVTNVDGFFSKFLSPLYIYDYTTNALPSLHASQTVLAALILSKFWNKRNSWLFVITIIMLLSTLFVKQHYFLDILAGILLGIVIYIIFFIWIKESSSKRLIKENR